MWRHLSRPREGWRDRVVELGLVYPDTKLEDGSVAPYWNEEAWYELTMDEVLEIERVTEELYVMCLAAAKHMATSGDFTDESLALPAGALQLVRESLDRNDPSVYARFDLAINGDSIKMLEINGDTPTGLVETAVIQWDWLEQKFTESDQFNSLHDRLIKRWKDLKDAGTFPGDLVHFFHSAGETSGEEEMTVTYMRDTAQQAGLATIMHYIEDLGWHSQNRAFVDWSDSKVKSAFKLYPWEDMLREEFGKYIMNHDELLRTNWVEPAWKLMLSTKAILPVLWQLYPGHKNLLPAYFEGPQDLPQWVAKPFQGREGDNIRVHLWEDEEDIVNPGGYADQPLVYQEYTELPSFDGNKLVVGSWIVDGCAAGILMRESNELVTDYYSRVVPHAIGAELRPSEEQVKQWLQEPPSVSS